MLLNKYLLFRLCPFCGFSGTGLLTVFSSFPLLASDADGHARAGAWADILHQTLIGHQLNAHDQMCCSARDSEM